MKRKVRRIDWYTVEKEKTNDPKLSRIKRTAFLTREMLSIMGLA
jgi:hypothetical protein